MSTLRRHAFKTWPLLIGVLAVTGLLIAATDPPEPATPADPGAATAAAPVALPAAGPAVEDNHYVGANKCKNCHKAEAGGDQYGHWEKSKHSKAFEALASDAAKKAAADRGVEGSPQEAAACLKCHSTGYGEPEDAFAKGFKADAGVQCESCHGMGEKHVKARFAAAMKAKDGEVEPPAEGEIVARPDATVCTGCHNKESPTFEGFCFKTYSRVIRHLDPRRELTEEQKKAMEGPCEHGEECPHDPAKRGEGK